MSTMQDKVAALDNGLKAPSFPTTRTPDGLGTGGSPSERERSVPRVSLG